jgi:hypothetical protein
MSLSTKSVRYFKTTTYDISANGNSTIQNIVPQVLTLSLTCQSHTHLSSHPTPESIISRKRSLKGVYAPSQTGFSSSPPTELMCCFSIMYREAALVPLKVELQHLENALIEVERQILSALMKLLPAPPNMGKPPIPSPRRFNYHELVGKNVANSVAGSYAGSSMSATD